MRLRLATLLVLAALGAAGCALGWRHGAGTRALDEGGNGCGRVSVVVPAGWHHVARGDDLVLTRDGVYLQNVLVERVAAGQEEPGRGLFPQAALSSKQWPLGTACWLAAPFAPDVTPAAAGAAVVEALRRHPAVTELAAGDVETATVAGRAAFRVAAAFRLDVGGPRPDEMPLIAWDAYDVLGRRPRYRTVVYGVVDRGCVVLLRYTATARVHFERDVRTFEDLVRTVAFDD